MTAPDAFAFAVAALVIAFPTVVVLAVMAAKNSRRPKYQPGIMFWSEMQPGNRYHVEINAGSGSHLVFTDEFVGYSHGNTKAHFAGRSVLWEGTDQIRVNLAGPA